MRAWRICAALFLAAATLVVGTTAEAKRKAQVTVTFDAVSVNQTSWDPIIANFKRVFPNIDVKPNYFQFQQYGQILRTEFQAGNAADVMVTAGGSNRLFSVVPFAQQGLVSPLLNAAWAKRLPPEIKALASLKRGSKGSYIYGAPVNVTFSGLPLYNRGLFGQNGWKAPTTFNELLSLCKTISAKGIYPIATSAGPGGDASLLLQGAASELLPADWAQKRLKGQTTFAASSEWRAAAQMMLDMKAAGCFNPSPQSTNVQAGQALFASGKAAMMITSLTNVGLLRSLNPNVNIGAFPLPVPTAANIKVVYQTSALLSINSKTAHPKEARTFVDFVAGRVKQTTLWNKIAGTLAPYDFVRGNLPDYLSGLSNAVKANKRTLNVAFFFPNTSVQVTLDTDTQGLFTGQKTIDQFLADLDKAWG